MLFCSCMKGRPFSRYLLFWRIFCLLHAWRASQYSPYLNIIHYKKESLIPICRPNTSVEQLTPKTHPMKELRRPIEDRLNQQWKILKILNVRVEELSDSGGSKRNGLRTNYVCKKDWLKFHRRNQPRQQQLGLLIFSRRLKSCGSKSSNVSELICL
jgi:hypothetical protein